MMATSVDAKQSGRRGMLGLGRETLTAAPPALHPGGPDPSPCPVPAEPLAASSRGDLDASWHRAGVGLLLPQVCLVLSVVCPLGPCPSARGLSPQPWTLPSSSCSVWSLVPWSVFHSAPGFCPCCAQGAVRQHRSKAPTPERQLPPTAGGPRPHPCLPCSTAPRPWGQSGWRGGGGSQPCASSQVDGGPLGNLGSGEQDPGHSVAPSPACGCTGPQPGSRRACTGSSPRQWDRAHPSPGLSCTGRMACVLYVSVCICVHVCVVFVHACLHVCACVTVCMCMSVCAHICVNACACVSVCACVCTCMCVLVCLCA